MQSSQKISRTSSPFPRCPMTPHCRICGYTPRVPKPGEPDFRFEKIVDHLEAKHPCQVLGVFTEFNAQYLQMQGDDSRCEFHGKTVEVIA